MALNTTPEEAELIHELGAKPAREIASKWLSNVDGYRNGNKRFRDSLNASLGIVKAGVSAPALEVNQALAESWVNLNSRSSQYSKICREVEAEILGYALEAQDAETLELFKSVLTR